MKQFPTLSEAGEQALVEKLSHWSLANGLVMYPPGFSLQSATNAPVTLFPTPFPKEMFNKALEVQQPFNVLYTNIVAKHKDWLLQEVKLLTQFDKDFTGMLYSTYLKAIELNGGAVAQPLSLGIFRSDYMYDESQNAIRQIEFNTVSVSFGGLSTKVGQAQNYLNRAGAYDETYARKYYAEGDIPISESLHQIALGLLKANAAYNGETLLDTVILFVVQPNERNCFDQRLIEYELMETHHIKSYRLTLENVELETTVNGGKLYIRSTMDEVSVVYYRSGYSPSDYQNNPEKTWSARLHLENSKAIKCPSLLTQLSGAKKIQQVLTNPDMVKRFAQGLSEAEISQLLDTFVKIYPLDDSEDGKVAKELAFQLPENFVLKPQREGGGNNIYKANIPTFLQSLPQQDWGAHILMELINPPTHKNKILRDNKVYNEDIICELGVFGNILFNEVTGDVLFNDNAGHLLRSKFSSSDEGGVAAGFGCVDNVYLY